MAHASLLNEEHVKVLNHAGPLFSKLVALRFWRDVGNFYMAKQVYSFLNERFVGVMDAEEGKIFFCESALLFSEISDWQQVDEVFVSFGQGALVDPFMDSIWRFQKQKLSTAPLSQALDQLPQMNYYHFKFLMEVCFIRSPEVLASLLESGAKVYGMNPFEQPEFDLLSLYFSDLLNKKLAANQILSRARDLGMHKRLPLLKERFLGLLV